MLNSAASHSKTAPAPVRAPCCEKSSRGKGLMEGSSPRYRRAYETSKMCFRDIWQRLAELQWLTFFYGNNSNNS